MVFIFTFFIAMSLNIFLCWGKDIHFEITVDNNRISLGSSVQLNLSFYGTQSIPAPSLGEIEGFRVRYVGPSTRISIVNGKISTSITHIYRLIPLKTGTFTVGPFSIEYKGKTFTSNSIDIEVISGHHPYSYQKTSPSSSCSINEEELKDRIFLTIEPAKTKVYLNEIIPLTVKLYVNRLAIRDIQYPKLKSEGFIVKEFDKPTQYRETLNDLLYDVVEFKTYAFATKTGNLVLGEADIECNLMLRREHRMPSSFDDFFGSNIFEDFFGTYETYPIALSSPKVNINVLPLPEENQPLDFKGAVGDFSFDAEVSPADVSVGDPVTLKMKIEGEGNFDTVIPPALESKENIKVYEPETEQEENVKTFTQVIIPQSEEVKDIPKISFSFFNPKDGKYHTITKGPFSLNVKPASGREAKITDLKPHTKETFPQETLGKDILYIKESIGKLKRKDHYLYKNAAYWLFQIITLIAFISFVALYKHKERLKTDTRYAQKLQAPLSARKGIKIAENYLKTQENDKFFDAIFNTLKKYFKNKLHLYSGEITYSAIENVLKTKNVEATIMDKLRNVFEKCEMARYASSEFSKNEMESIFKDIREIIDYLERKRI